MEILFVFLNDYMICIIKIALIDIYHNIILLLFASCVVVAFVFIGKVSYI